MPRADREKGEFYSDYTFAAGGAASCCVGKAIRLPPSRNEELDNSSNPRSIASAGATRWEEMGLEVASISIPRSTHKWAWHALPRIAGSHDKPARNRPMTLMGLGP